MRLNGGLDAAALAGPFQKAGRLHIANIIVPAEARALYEEIAAQRAWSFVLHAKGKNIDLDAAGWANLDPAAKQKTIDIVHENASHDFTYMHYRLSVYDRYHKGKNLPPRLLEVFEFLNGEPFLSFVRAVTGAADIAFADAQLTAFGPGHFLTIHNDDVEGKNRRAAYVLNLTPEWREDWGGYLNFFDNAGHVTGAYKPSFNALNIFRVPALHSVGVVAPFALKPRIAISGWLRAGGDPMAA